jgi:low temperature requirement protein LtrA
MVAQWLRAAVQHPDGRPCALRYATGIAACQVGWILLLVAPDAWWIGGFVVLAVCEMAVPAWAERQRPTDWHPGHIGERYGLFTIIVLGESVLAASAAVEAALSAGAPFGDLVTTAVGGFLVVCALWWIYFDLPTDQLLARARTAFEERNSSLSFVWGYGHYFVFASLAAVGVGIAVAVDQIVHHSALTDLEAGFVLTVPVAVFLIAVLALNWRFKHSGLFRLLGCPITAVAVLAASWTAEWVLLTGLILCALVAVTVVRAAALRD